MSVHKRLQDESFDDRLQVDQVDDGLIATNGDLKFECVSYGYPNSKNFILNNISLTIKAGAIVGIEGVLRLG